MAAGAAAHFRGLLEPRLIARQLGALFLALNHGKFSHEPPQFLNGKRNSDRSALHSSSVLAVVVKLMFRPRRASTLS